MAFGGTIRAGELRHKVQVRRSAMVSDGFGGQLRTTSTVAILRCKVEGLDGRESVMAHALTGISTYRITTRFRPGLLPTDQLVLDDGRVLNITSICDVEGRRIQLQLLATTASVVADPGAAS